MSYHDAVNKSVKLHPPDREALDAVVEQSDEWGNVSAAIRGLIRQAAAGETVTDGGTTDRDETHHPEVDRLDAIYTAALQLVDHSHVLPDDDCATVARLVANDGDNPWSPREDAVRRSPAGVRLRRPPGDERTPHETGRGEDDLPDETGDSSPRGVEVAPEERSRAGTEAVRRAGRAAGQSSGRLTSTRVSETVYRRETTLPT
jgi:hypothetical protein